MKQFLKIAAAMMLVAAVAATSFAAGSPSKQSGFPSYNGYNQDTPGSGSGSGSGGGSSSSGGSGVKVIASNGPGMLTPVTSVNPSNPGEPGMGNGWIGGGNDWSYIQEGQELRAQWANLINPYYNNAVQMFCFDGSGNCVSGWRWIMHQDGHYHCYYFIQDHNGQYGALLRNATTPDGYQVNENGEWVVNGVVQVR